MSVSNQHYVLVSHGVAAMPSGQTTALVELLPGGIGIVTGTFWGRIGVEIRIGAESLYEIDAGDWEAIESGTFKSSGALQLESDSGEVWSDFDTARQLPTEGNIAFRVHARGRTEAWGRDFPNSPERHLIVLWADDPVVKPYRSLYASDGRNIEQISSSEVDSIPSMKDSRATTLGPHVF